MSLRIVGVLPTFDELPSFHDFKGCAWDVWGKDDELGTINLLTPEVVAQAAQEEIRCVYLKRDGVNDNQYCVLLSMIV
jgi:hypothetical protein